MIRVLISTRSQLQIEDDLLLSINQYASVSQLFNEYKKQVDVSQFDSDSSLQFKNICFEEVVMVWQKEPLKILEKGTRLRDIDQNENLNIIIYLPSPSQPIIICQCSNSTCIIWNYRNMKPLINTLEGDPLMRKVVNGQVLKVIINGKMYLWNDVKNKTMRSLMEGKLGTIISMKLEVDPKFDNSEHYKTEKPIQAKSIKQYKENIIVNNISNGISQGQNQAAQNKEQQNEKSIQIKKDNLQKGQQNEYIQKGQNLIIMQKKQILEKRGFGENKIEIKPEQRFLPTKPQQIKQNKIEQIIEHAEPFLQKKISEGKTPAYILSEKKEPIQQVIKFQENKIVNNSMAGPNPLKSGDLTLQIKFQATYSTTSGRKSITRQVSKNQCLSDLLPSIIKQLKSNGFDWSDDSFDPTQDKKKISITYNNSQFHKLTKAFKSLVNIADKQIVFNITRHYEGG